MIFALPAWTCRRLSLASLALTLGACATYYDDPSQYQSGEVSTAGGAGRGGSDAPGGAAGSLVGGTASVAGGGSAAAGQGGASAGAAGAPAGGAASGGMAGAGGGMGGAAAGMGGGGSAGAGGKPAGGAGGVAAGGQAGAGGSPPAHPCDEHPITAKSKWQVTASSSDGPAPPALAVDDDAATRWTTGKEQVGGEWLQVDFGATVTLTQLTLVLGSSANDYPRKYTTRFSNTSQNTAAPVLLSGMGAPNSDTVLKFPQPTSGRYLLITQGGVAQALWWSVAELQAQCVD